MKVVGLLSIGCLVGLCAMASAADDAAPAQLTQAATPAPPAASAPVPSNATVPPPAAAPADPAAQQASPQQAQQAPPVARTREERRRLRTYARCNRAAYARNLYGGARRRFLIRCRLGYERGIGQPPPVGQPPRKP